MTDGCCCRRIVWIGDRTAARVGFGWEMSNINLHAISRDTSAFPEPCLYCQVGRAKLPLPSQWSWAFA